jgi:hypothetical protein
LNINVGETDEVEMLCRFSFLFGSIRDRLLGQQQRILVTGNNLTEIKTLVNFRAAGSSVFIGLGKKIDPINIL